MSLRADFGAHLRANAPSGVTVYDIGQDVAAPPCVVINPADPYLLPKTFGKNSRVTHMIEVSLVVSRADIASAMDDLERLFEFVATNAKDFTPAGTWTRFGQFGSTDIAGVDYATATVGLVFVGQYTPPPSS